MSYQGLEMTSQEAYVFSDTIPYNPEFDLEELKAIQTKLENYTSGKTTNGITSQEATIFLDWITFNTRSYAVRNIPESAITAAMTGQCAPTQRINVTLLRKLGLDARPFNTADCIGDIPMNEKDKRRVQNGWNSSAVRHSVSLLNLPIMDNNGITQSYKFLLDPTFRQFCLKENCDGNKFVNNKWLSRGYVAPHPGYFMQANNLIQLGVSEEIAQKTEALGKYIISRGYFYLNEENAKLYGDTFVRASKRLEFQTAPIYMSGLDYINNFDNIPMKMLPGDRSDEDFTKLPSEIEQPKQSRFSKIKNFFKEKFEKIFGKKPETLSSGITTDSTESPRKPSKLESAALTKEAHEQFRIGETQVLNSYIENQNHYDSDAQEQEIS